jgi:hypothetical protein
MLQAFVFSALAGGQWSASRAVYNKAGRYSYTNALRRATRRKVAGSIPDGITVVFR